MRRHALKTTPEELAEVVGISLQQMRTYESGHNHVSFSPLAQIGPLIGRVAGSRMRRRKFAVDPQRVAQTVNIGRISRTALNPAERNRLIGLTQADAEAAATQVRFTIEDRGTGVLVRGVLRQAAPEHVETLNLSWDLVERSGAPERFLLTRVWPVERGLTPAGIDGRPRP